MDMTSIKKKGRLCAALMRAAIVGLVVAFAAVLFGAVSLALALAGVCVLTTIVVGVISPVPLTVGVPGDRLGSPAAPAPYLDPEYVAAIESDKKHDA